MSKVATKIKTDLLALKGITQFYHILGLLLELFTILWCDSPLIMVQLRTNFSSQQINASFWCNIEQNFLQCTVKFQHEHLADRNTFLSI